MRMVASGLSFILQNDRKTDSRPALERAFKCNPKIQRSRPRLLIGIALLIAGALVLLPGSQDTSCEGVQT